MKKLSYLLSVILPIALLFGISDANAQRKNDTKKDVNVESSMEKPNAKMPKTEKMHKGKHDKGYKLEKQNREINEDYDEAVEKIGKSSFSAEQKQALTKQAAENRDLAMKQAKEKHDLRMKHWKAREGMKDAMKAEKHNRKAVKEVDDID